MSKSDRTIADCATLLGYYIRTDGNGLDDEERKAARIASGYSSTGGFFLRPGAPGALLTWLDSSRRRADVTDAGRRYYAEHQNEDRFLGRGHR
jgi:hypothetical protein